MSETPKESQRGTSWADNLNRLDDGMRFVVIVVSVCLMLGLIGLGGGGCS